MQYMLDTNICIYLIKKQSQSLIEKISQLSPNELCISSITMSELEYGVSKSLFQEKNRIALYNFVTPINILPYDAKSSLWYGKIRSFLEKQGNTIGPLDLLIASHALAHNLTLITHNTKEFNRVNELKVEDWI